MPVSRHELVLEQTHNKGRAEETPRYLQYFVVSARKETGSIQRMAKNLRLIQDLVGCANFTAYYLAYQQIARHCTLRDRLRMSTLLAL